jgi:putative endonuclease
MKGGWVYIMADAPYGTIYIGATAHLAARIYQHRTGRGSDFCQRYDLHRLVYVEEYPTIQEAIAREKAMKAWKRIWKTDRISAANPDGLDLFDQINT